MTAVQTVDLDLPFWAKAILFVLKLIPGIPAIIITIVEIALAVISKLPKPERERAKAELREAVRQAKSTGNAAPVEQVAKKYWEQHCRGRFCPADVKRI